MFNAWDAAQVGPGNFPLFFPANYGREPGYIYLIALFKQFLGLGAWTIRLPAAICGTLTVVLTYTMVRRLLGGRIGMLAAALMAVSLWPVLMSRVGLRAVLLPPLQALAIYAVDRGVRGRSVPWATAAGVALGLMPYTYIPGQVFPAVVLIWLALVLLFHHRRSAGGLKHLVVAAGLALLVALPFILFAVRNAEATYTRVGELNYELTQLMAGNWRPAWRSTRAVLRMFTWTGDPMWRYNPSLRPVFDWVTGAFFYLGLLISLVRIRKPGYLLLILWLPLMLAPAMLTGASPSFLRSSGALVAIYILPAVGVDFLWQLGERWLGRWLSVTFSLLAAIGLTLVAADTWHDYFIDWPSHYEVCHTYESDLAAAARYLDRYQDPEIPAWISSEYAYDLSPLIFGFQSHRTQDPRWFDGTQGTVWPAAAHGQDVLVLFTESAPASPTAQEALAPYQMYVEEAPCGEPHLWVYRIPAAALDDLPWQPQHSLTGQFAHGVEVLGYDAATHTRRGEMARFTLYWRVPAEHRYQHTDPPRTYVCLEDAAGHCWSESSHFAPYPVRDWTAGDIFIEEFEVPVPVDLPPQEMTFHVGQYTGARQIVFAHPERGGIPLQVGALQVTGQVTTTPEWDADTPIYGSLALLESSLLSLQTHGGGEIEASLTWQAVDPPEEAYGVRFQLTPAGSEEPALTHDAGLWPGRHPTSAWLAEEKVRSFHAVPVPRDFPGGDYVLAAVLISPDGEALGSPVEVGGVSVSSRPHSFELPQPQVPVDAVFGDSIRLLGYDLSASTVEAAGQFDLTLYWQSMEGVEEDYTVFVHLYHPSEDAILGQHDSPPGAGQIPTGTWLPGEVVADPHTIVLEPVDVSGEAPLGVGLYLPATGERLPVEGDRVSERGDRLILTEIEVR
jgi:hypothetical protein